MKISTFKNGKPEEFLVLTNNFKSEIDGTGTTSAPGRINYLLTMLHGESLQEFDELASQINGTTNANLNFIKERILGYFTGSMNFPSISARFAAKSVNYTIRPRP